MFLHKSYECLLINSVQIILDSAASFNINQLSSPANEPSTRPHLLVFSANDSTTLAKMVNRYQEYVSRFPSALNDLAYTLGARREHMKHRAFSVISPGAPLAISPFSKSKVTPEINFVFTGQGAQWAGMGKELITDFVSFHGDIRAMDNVLAQLPDPPNWTIEGDS